MHDPRDTSPPFYVALHEASILENDAEPNTRRRNKSNLIRGPPVQRAAYTIPEFCKAFRISEDFFFKLLREGAGPKVMRIGRRTLISVQAAEIWRLERERAALSD